MHLSPQAKNVAIGLLDKGADLAAAGEVPSSPTAEAGSKSQSRGGQVGGGAEGW